MSDSVKAEKICSSLPPGGPKDSCVRLVEFCEGNDDWPANIETDFNIDFYVDETEQCFGVAKILAVNGKNFIQATTSTSTFSATPAVTREERGERGPLVHPDLEASVDGKKVEFLGKEPGFCTEKTGFIPVPRAEIRIVGGKRKLLIDGKEYADRAPIVDLEMGQPGYNTIILPSRRVHFKLGLAEPVDHGKFKEAVATMVGDIKNTLSGPFSRICGLHYIKQLAGKPVLYVVGKTDRLGDDEKNLQLSIKRARRVAEEIGKHSDEIGKHLWVGGGRELTIKYVGVGERMTETEDEVASPEDRRVELYLSTKRPPFQAGWVEVQHIEGRTPDRDEVLSYHCAGSDDDCEVAVKQCVAALPHMCEAVHPDDAEARKACTSSMELAWSEESWPFDRNVTLWLDNDYLRFPLFYYDGGKIEKEYASSLDECFRRAAIIADRHKVSKSMVWKVKGDEVTNPEARKGRLPEGTEVCTAERGWMESSKVWVARLPEGDILYHGDERAGMFYGEEFIAKRNLRVTGRNTLVMPPLRHVGPGGLSPETAAKRTAGDVMEFIDSGPFVKKCLSGTRALKELNISIYYNVLGVDKEQVTSFVEEVRERLDAQTSRFRRLFWDINLVLVPVAMHRPGFIVEVGIGGKGASDDLDPVYPRLRGLKPEEKRGKTEVIPLD